MKQLIYLKEREYSRRREFIARSSTRCSLLSLYLNEEEFK